MDSLTLLYLSRLESARGELRHRALVPLLLTHVAEILPCERSHAYPAVIITVPVCLSVDLGSCPVPVLAPQVPGSCNGIAHLRRTASRNRVRGDLDA